MDGEPRSTPAVRILIVEDHELLAQSLRLALRAEGHVCEVADLGDLDALLAEVERTRPQLALLDLDLGDRLGDGALLVPALVARGVSVLVVSGTTDETRVGEALEAGAVGYVAKAQPFEDLLATVLAVAVGETVMDAGRRDHLLAALRRRRESSAERRAPFDRLSPREREVLVALCEGASVETIARGWVVSEATVRSQVRGVLTKLGVSSQLAAVAAARRAGWV